MVEHVNDPHELRVIFLWFEKAKNEKFFHLFGSKLPDDKFLLGSCYQALQDCALPDIKNVNPAAKRLILRLGHHYPESVEEAHDDATERGIEVSVRVHKVTSKASPVSLKRFVRRGAGAGGAGGETDDEDEQMADGEGKYAPVERETRYHLKPEKKEEVEKVKEEEGEEQEQEHEQVALGDLVDPEDLVKGYKYGATWVLVDEEFERLPTKAGIEVCLVLILRVEGCVG